MSAAEAISCCYLALRLAGWRRSMQCKKWCCRALYGNRFTSQVHQRIICGIVHCVCAAHHAHSHMLCNGLHHQMSF